VIRKDGSEYFAKNAQLFGMALQSRKGRFAFHDIHPQMRQCQCQDQASFNVNVAGLLRQMLRAKSLIINDVTGVAGFPDLHINLACLAPHCGNFIFLPFPDQRVFLYSF
jgi:hypothetical protein